MSLRSLASLLGIPATDETPESPILRVITDSREAREGDLFVGLRGPRADGARFVRQVLDAGAVGAVAGAEGLDAASRSDVRVLAVADPLEALGALGGAVRALSRAQVVGITGSVGKTTFKEFLGRLLAAWRPTVRARRSFNNAEGVARTLVEIAEDTAFAVVECGTNAPGEIRALARRVRPDVAVFTAIGAAHLEGLGSVAGVFEEKWDLARALPAGGLLILNGDDPHLRAAVGREDLRVLRPGLLPGPGIDAPAERAPGRLVDAAGGHVIEHALGTPVLEGTLWMAWRTARTLGAPPELLLPAAKDLRPAPLRGEMRTLGRTRLILDCYNANPLSMEAALRHLDEVAGRRVAVLGEMRELGARTEAEHRALAARVARSGYDAVLFVGPSHEIFREAGLPDAHPDLASARSGFRRLLEGGGTMLLKGSRGIALEGLLEDPS